MAPATLGPARKVPYSKGMSPAMAARWAFLCALIAPFGGLSVARAERRPVAVVNLDTSDSSPAKALADELNTALRNHPDLSQLPPTDAAALQDPIEDLDRAGLDAARGYKQRADSELIQFNNNLAATYADEGEKELLSVTPTAAQKLYADLAFVRGQALLADAHPADAIASFGLCARLDPDRVLDAARYLPEVVEAYAKAKTATGAQGSITVAGTGRVWIDGIEVGQAPGGFAVSAGLHVIWLTGSERYVRGERAIVTANKIAEVKIGDAGVQRGTLVQRARMALVHAADATARSAAINNLAKLVGANDAVLLQVSKDKIVVQTWRAGNVERSPGFSALREYKDEKAVDLLTPLAPPKKVEPVEPPFIPVRPVVVTKWYRRPVYQTSIVVGVVAVIVGGYFLSQAGADTFTPNGNVGFGGDASSVVHK